MGNEMLNGAEPLQSELPPIWSSRVDLRYDIQLRPTTSTGFKLHIIDTFNEIEIHREPMELVHDVNEQGLHIEDIIKAKKLCLRHIDQHRL